MKSSLECVYKGIEEYKGGSFLSPDGKEISYNAYYKLRFDQILNGLPKETSIRISKELALNTAKYFTLYDKIVINFNIIIYTSKNIICKITDIKKI